MGNKMNLQIQTKQSYEKGFVTTTHSSGHLSLGTSLWEFSGTLVECAFILLKSQLSVVVHQVIHVVTTTTSN